MLNTLLQNGKAIDKFREFIIRQGGDASFLDDHKLLPKATHIVEVRADKEGFVSRMDAEKLGRAAMKLGAGRETKDSIIDLAAGIMLRVKTGDRVKPGTVLAELHTNRTQQVVQAAVQEVKEYIQITDHEVPAKPFIYAVVTKDQVRRFH